MHLSILCRRRLALGFLSISFAAYGAEETPKKPVYGPVKSMSPEEFERTMGQQKKYEFELAPVDGLVDAAGAVIRADALPAYLKEHALEKDAYVMLWITAESPPLNALAPTVRPLGDYGITKIVVRARPGVTPKPGTPSDAAAKKTVFLQGKPNPAAIGASMPFPALDGRPAELRPEPLPRPVRYTFAPDAEVVAAARWLGARLLAVTPDAPPLFSDSVMVQPGAWKTLRATGGPGFKNVQPMNTMFPIGGRQVELQGTRLREAADLALLEERLHAMIEADGGGQVRALRSAEMAKWWTFIGFDIEEPTFVLESKQGKYRFVLGFSKGRLLFVDELNSLPDKF